MDPIRLIAGAVVSVALVSIVLRLTMSERAEGWSTRRRLVAGIALGLPVLAGVVAIGIWATRPILPGEFSDGNGESYFVGEGGTGGGPGAVGCVSMSAIQAQGGGPLIPVGHLSVVTPLTSENAWLSSVPVGFEVFRDTHPPAHPRELWVRTGDDCYVWAHGYLG